MKYDAKFWYSMVILQFLFGLTVFSLTRYYYHQEAGVEQIRTPTISQSGADMAWLAPQASSSLLTENPMDISRQADSYFSSRQYDKAAAMYERMLVLRPNDGEVLNNLGLTLHYLGRSNEALRRLEEGVAADPENQRTWLTLGYVNSALGNTVRARQALTEAMQTGEDESIREAAAKMLERLP